MQGHPPPRREAGEGVAGCLVGRPDRGGTNSEGGDGRLIARCLTAHPSRIDGETETFVATTLRARDGSRGVDSDCTDTLLPVAFAQNQRDEVRTMAVVGALAAQPGMKQQTYIASSAVRRLTPRECEALQGFKADWTLVPHRGKPAADGPRYMALGNSMAVPVMAWIGGRIVAQEAQMRRIAA